MHYTYYNRQSLFLYIIYKIILRFFQYLSIYVVPNSKII